MLQLVAHLLHLADDPQKSERGASKPGKKEGEEEVEMLAQADDLGSE